MTRAELRYVSTRKLAPRRRHYPAHSTYVVLFRRPSSHFPLSLLVACLVFFLSGHFDVLGPSRSSLVDKRAAPPVLHVPFFGPPVHTYIYIHIPPLPNRPGGQEITLSIFHSLSHSDSSAITATLAALLPSRIGLRALDLSELLLSLTASLWTLRPYNHC